MNQLQKLLSRFNPRQRVSLAVVAILVVFGLYSLVHWNRERDFKPLYSGLSAEDAGAIVAKLKESATEYRLGRVQLIRSGSIGPRGRTPASDGECRNTQRPGASAMSYSIRQIWARPTSPSR